MGILNITPDSFYDGGKYSSNLEVGEQIEKLIAEGADIIDIGGHSSRPGAEHVPEKEEFERIRIGLDILVKNYPEMPVSVDTFRSEVARRCIEAGAAMINDVSGGNLDAEMFNTIADLKVPYVLMHMRGSPSTMQELNSYDNLLKNILDELQKKYNSLIKLGVKDVLIDVGFGFAKSVSQNYELLRNLDYFHILNVPILVGISRKSMVYKSIGTTPEGALNGTTALHTIALIKGASMLRVHDVRAAKEAVTLFKLAMG